MNSEQRTCVGVTASFTPQLLLRAMTRVLGAEDVDVQVADYNQVHQSLMDPSSSFERAPGLLVVLWRVEDVFEASLVEWIMGTADESGLLEDVRQLGALVAQAARAGGTSVVASTPPVPEPHWLDPLDTRTSVRLSVLHGRLLEAYLEGIGDAPVTLLDLAALVRVHGSEQAYDTRNDLMYHQPFSSRFAQELGTLLGEAIASLGRPVPKVLAVDADNTLWGGIVGEDGPDGVVVGDSFPGNAFRAFQQGLAYQAANGALLALVSKNNEDDVDELFEQRSGDLVLTPKHFAARRVDWNSKADNIGSIADELNLGVDSFVFVDDNDVELDEVRQRCSASRWSRSATSRPRSSACASLPAFRFARVSSEDRERTAMMQVERDRKSAASEAPSHEEFLRSLKIQVHVFGPSSAQVGRVTQLVNKTNQFNLTTIRRDESQVSAFVDSDAHRVYAAEVSDRFGGYGLVAVAIVDVPRRPVGHRHLPDELPRAAPRGRGLDPAVHRRGRRGRRRHVAPGALRADGQERPGRHVLPRARLPRHR